MSIKEVCENYITENFEESVAAGKTVREYLLKSPLAFMDRCVQTLQIPKIFEQKHIADFREITNITCGIFYKIMKEYQENKLFREIFPFQGEERDCIALPVPYDSLLPMVRIDIFYNEEDGSFKFCEFNTDGTSAMIEDVILKDAFSMNNLSGLLDGKLDSFELFDSWVHSVERIYRTYPNPKQHPRIVIADFLDKAYLPEFDMFLDHFKKFGYDAEICDIRTFTYEDGVLYTKEKKPVDIIYRRGVTRDIFDDIDHVHPFVEAIKDQNVCVIGNFITQVIHHKSLFILLRDERVQAILNEKERAFIEAHVPVTFKLTPKTVEQAQKGKERWIIKPSDSYGSKGVFAGVDYTDEEWRKIVEDIAELDYIIQEYHTPYKTKNLDILSKEPIFKDYSNLTGLYVYDGILAGMYSRLSDGGIISSQYNEKSVPTFVLRDETVR